MAITLDDDTKQRLHASLQRYCAEHLDENVGMHKAGKLLEFLLYELGPYLYGQAIKDVQAKMEGKSSGVAGPVKRADGGAEALFERLRRNAAGPYHDN
jgi:uncharacterized protein (DUF2164 family)